MKPLKIEPKDVYVVFEISASQLESVVDYIEKMRPIESKFISASSEVIGDVEDFISVANEILKHPLVERELENGA